MTEQENKMAEEKVTTARRARQVVDATPESYGPDATGLGEVVSVKDISHVPESPSGALRAFLAYRRAEIHRPRLGGNIGGAAAMNAAQAEMVLRELERFADFLDAGCPKPNATLSEEDKVFYRAAVARDLPVPEEIRRQL